MRSSSNPRWQSVKVWLCGVMVLALLCSGASAQETYRFERLWPTLQQP